MGAKPAFNVDQLSTKTIMMDNVPVSHPNAVQSKDSPDQAAWGIHIYPNPVKDGLLNIIIDNGFCEQLELSIIDFSGKLILQKHYEQVNSLTLNLSAYPPALYLIHIRSNNFRFSGKFTIR